MGHVQFIAILLVISAVTLIVSTDAKPQSSSNTFSTYSSSNNQNTGFTWTQTDTEKFDKEFESHEKTVKNIAGMIIGIVIGVFVLMILGVLACCCIPACMCARGAGSSRGAVISRPPADRVVTQPLYPVQTQGGGAYPNQPTQAVPYGQPIQYPIPHQTIPNMSQPPPYPAAADWSATGQNKQAPYNPYYQDGGSNPPNAHMTAPPYPPK